MLPTRTLGWLLPLACCAVAACAASEVTPGADSRSLQELAAQEIAVATDPEGARCDLLQDGKVVASIAATPGVASVPRDFCRSGVCPPEALPALGIACRKDGFRERRMRFPVAWSYEIDAENGRSGSLAGRDPWEFTVGAANRAAVQFAAVAAPPLGVGLAVLAIGTDVAYSDAHPSYQYAYRSLPRIALVPVAFESPEACDAFFDSLRARLVGARDVEQRGIDAQCHPWPCGATGSACLNPICQRQRDRVDANLRLRLDETVTLRAEACVSLPSP